ncbi:MAG: GNAT family N-acetyltransferase [Anaerolineaceae bacterium]|jgi:ribosomal protein S18 acetylase RimI-like enzyme|nr:GNAT family N-acetyltransferase [Anaerolineaceae bacterium]
MNERLEYTLEVADWRDLNALQQMERACFGNQSWTLLDLIGVLTLTGVVRMKAVHAGEMIGFAAAESRAAENTSWITTIGVLPAYRRNGVAAALLAACEARVSMPRMRLCVRTANWMALRLYEERGYQRVGVWQNYYTNGEDALVLEKYL